MTLSLTSELFSPHYYYKSFHAVVFHHFKYTSSFRSQKIVCVAYTIEKASAFDFYPNPYQSVKSLFFSSVISL